MAGYRKPFKRGKPPVWVAGVWSPAKNDYVKHTLFPKRHRHHKNPALATKRLRPAWERVRDGKLPTAGQAERRAEELADELLRGGGTVPDTVTLEELVALELSCPGKSRARKVATMNSVRHELKRFRDFIQKHAPAAAHDIRCIRRAHIHDFIGKLRAGGYAEGTARNSLAYVRRAFNLAVERELLEKNPCAGVRIERPNLNEEKKQVQAVVLTPDEVQRLLRAAREPYYKLGRTLKDGTRKRNTKSTQPPMWLHPFVLTSLETAARLGELLPRRVKDSETGEYAHSRGLRWRDIDWNKSVIHVEGKTGPRPVPLTPVLADTLKALQKKQLALGFPYDYVFTNDSGEPLVHPQKVFEGVVKRAGIGRHVHPHQLRHTALTLYAASPHVSVAVVQKIAGHSTPAMTAKYIHTDEETMVAAALKAKRDTGMVSKVVSNESSGGNTSAGDAVENA